MRKLSGFTISDNKFSFPFRMILSGSSGSGKTFFAEKLLRRNDLFKEKVSNVAYYYPGYLSRVPVQWENELDIPVSYREGLPTKEELVQLPRHTCVVIDDMYDRAVQSSCIDHLFRVISGKQRLCVMIMTQNNFTKGRYGREIRNSCNFSVLFRNCCDTSINEKTAHMSGLKNAYAAASRHAENEMYPYVFIDQSQQGQLSSYRLYTDIFSRFMKVWSLSGMKGYIIGESDFEIFFDIYQREGSNTFEATKNEDKNKNKAANEERNSSKSASISNNQETEDTWWNITSSEESENEHDGNSKEGPGVENSPEREYTCDEKEQEPSQGQQSAEEQPISPEQQRPVSDGKLEEKERRGRCRERRFRRSRYSRRDKYSHSRRRKAPKRLRNALFES